MKIFIFLQFFYQDINAESENIPDDIPVYSFVQTPQLREFVPGNIMRRILTVKGEGGFIMVFPIQWKVIPIPRDFFKTSVIKNHWKIPWDSKITRFPLDFQKIPEKTPKMRVFFIWNFLRNITISCDFIWDSRKTSSQSSGEIGFPKCSISKLTALPIANSYRSCDGAHKNYERDLWGPALEHVES